MSRRPKARAVAALLGLAVITGAFAGGSGTAWAQLTLPTPTPTVTASPPTLNCAFACVVPTYIKSTNPAPYDYFGTTIALSADGRTLAVGVPSESSNGVASGAVYVYRRSGFGTWTPEAHITASNAEAFDQFGFSVALSANGDTLAVGAFGEASGATGVNGDSSDNSATYSGAAYVFTRTSPVLFSPPVWTEEAYIKATVSDLYDYFGASVALSADGNKLAGAAPGGTTTLADAYVFTRKGTTWTAQGSVSVSNPDLNASSTLALSGDGNTLVLGAPGDESNAVGINGNPANTSATESGAVYVFVPVNGSWVQQAYVKASNTETSDHFGTRFALSADGHTLAVGATGEDSNATGVGGPQADNSMSSSGAVYVFTRSGGSWTQQAYVKASNRGSGDTFGERISLSADGHTLAVGASGEDSNSTRTNTGASDNSAESSGAVYVFLRRAGSWSERDYIKAPNTGTRDYFGAVALDGSGFRLAVGAKGEDSSATGVGGNQADEWALNSGAVYVFYRLN